MNERSEQLLEAARRGTGDDFERWIEALHADETVTLQTIVEFAEASELLLRRAAIELAKRRWDANVLVALSRLSGDPEDQVRRELAAALVEVDWEFDDATVATLLGDSDAFVRCDACRAAAGRPGLFERLAQVLREDYEWTVRRNAAIALKSHDPPLALPALMHSLGSDYDKDVAEAAAEAIEEQVWRDGNELLELLRPTSAELRKACERIRANRDLLINGLRCWLEDRSRVEVDVAELSEFGPMLTDAEMVRTLPAAHFADDAVTAVLHVLRGTPPQSVVLLGNSGCGKTAIVYELARRLASQGWQMVQVNPSSFLTGTVYLGEWQTRLTKLVEAIKQPRPVILYLPNLEELSSVGRSHNSGANVATGLAPFIERNEILVLGESTDDAFKRGLGADPALRKLFHAIRIKPASEEATEAIVARVADDLGANASPAVVHRVCELADFSSVSAALPGRAVELLRRVVAGLPDPGQAISEADILATIRTSTGVPLEIIDDTIQLDRAAVRQFFEARVMGQPEAIDAAIDLVTLIKAGLTDPQKPFGVLLFVGPTGVGKTELARALAEFCFGNANRLTRLDMSEFATYDAFERLIGTPARPGYLTSLVNEQPFSILLFDELEKGHLNIYDLCLQIFDAGRLTDGQGRTADFRRTIIVLTSNVGAAGVNSEPIGFGPVRLAEPNAGQPGQDLRRAFRPEFLNRIDRIVQFQPLSMETAEKIAQREVARVLERSGIKRRNLVIDNDPSLMPLLLREGYSRTYGARPLKRAIERLVLLPLARAIAGGEVGHNALVRLLVRNGKVQVQISPTEEPESGEAPAAPAPLPADVMARLARLNERVAHFREQVADVSANKGALLARSAAPHFFDDPLGVRQTYEQIYVFDGVLAAVESLAKAARLFSDTVARCIGRQPAGRFARRLDDLEAQAAHVDVLLACGDPRLLGDAVISVTRVTGTPGTLNGVERIANMYLRLARRHGFNVEVLDDHRLEPPAGDTISLLVSGVGAYTLLAGEAGLHALSYGQKLSLQAKPPEREIVRVEVGFADVDPAAVARADVRAEIHALSRVHGRLLRRPKFDVELLHRPTMVSIRAWADGDEATLVNRLLPLLAARMAAADAPGSVSSSSIVRRYRLGPTQLVRDARTGRRTGRLDLVLAGHIDAFLVPLAAGDPAK